MSWKYLLLVFTMIPLHGWAQDAEGDTAEFTSDLFGNPLYGTDIMPKGRLQLETMAFYQHQKAGDEHYYSWSPMSMVLRYGINRTTELRLQGAWLHTTDEGTNYHGIADLAVGFKTNFFGGWKAVPTISLLANLYIPGGENYSFLPDHFGCELALLFSNSLTSWCSLSYMGGVIWDDAPRPTALWAAGLDFSLSEKLSLSIEEDNFYYGENEDDIGDRFQPWANLTLSYQVHPRVQLGASTDISLRRPGHFFDIMIGVAWQLTKR